MILLALDLLQVDRTPILSDQGDPTQKTSDEYKKKAMKQRSDFVSALFKERGQLEDGMQSWNEAKKIAAYQRLNQIINFHAKEIAKTEKTRLIKERAFFKNDEKRYKECLEAAKNVDADIYDNLTKMALHIVKKAESKLVYQ